MATDREFEDKMDQYLKKRQWSREQSGLRSAAYAGGIVARDPQAYEKAMRGLPTYDRMSTEDKLRWLREIDDLKARAKDLDLQKAKLSQMSEKQKADLQLEILKLEVDVDKAITSATGSIQTAKVGADTKRMEALIEAAAAERAKVESPLDSRSTAGAKESGDNLRNKMNRSLENAGYDPRNPQEVARAIRDGQFALVVANDQEFKMSLQEGLVGLSPEDKFKYMETMASQLGMSADTLLGAVVGSGMFDEPDMQFALQDLAEGRDALAESSERYMTTVQSAIDANAQMRRGVGKSEVMDRLEDARKQAGAPVTSEGQKVGVEFGGGDGAGAGADDPDSQYDRLVDLLDSESQDAPLLELRARMLKSPEFAQYKAARGLGNDDDLANFRAMLREYKQRRMKSRGKDAIVRKANAITGVGATDPQFLADYKPLEPISDEPAALAESLGERPESKDMPQELRDSSLDRKITDWWLRKRGVRDELRKRYAESPDTE